MAELNKGLVEFECGSGNNMSVEFPEVIEEDAHMNIGVALMPFMKEGFHFIKEDSFSTTKEVGINTIETSFVEYLYKIRKANRESKSIKHNAWTKLTSDPQEIRLRQRIFIAGKIFPVMSIRYHGGDIDCSSSNIEVKSYMYDEINTIYAGIFRDQGFSSKYLFIDKSISVYVPENTEMDIDYLDLLKDFLTNGKQTELVTKYGEFPNMDIYKLATDETILSDGCWLTKDREDNNDAWKKGCMYVVEHQLQGVLAPFSQIADFYSLLDDKITNETEHKTRWLKGAKKLVHSLGILDGVGGVTISNDVETILNELNVGICDYAITQFHDLFYGDCKNDPLDTLEKAYDWDLAFVKHEQGVVAVPIYSKTNKKTIEKYQNMADQDAIDKENPGSWHGLGGWGIDNVLRQKVIPEFDDPWEGKVTDAQFRIDLPMLMLWLDRHKPTGENFKDKIDEDGYLLKEYKKIIEKYEAK